MTLKSFDALSGGILTPALYLEGFLRLKKGEKIGMTKQQLDQGLKTWIDRNAHADHLQEKFTAMGSPLKFAVDYLKKKEKNKKIQVKGTMLDARNQQAMNYLEQQGVLTRHRLANDKNALEADTPEMEQAAVFVLAEEMFFNEINEPVFDLADNVYEERPGDDTEIEEQETTNDNTLDGGLDWVLEHETTEPQEAVTPIIAMTESALSDKYLHKATQENNASDAVENAMIAAHLDGENAVSAAHVLLDKIDTANERQARTLLGGVAGAVDKNQRPELSDHLDQVQPKDSKTATQMAYLQGNHETPAVTAAQAPPAVQAFQQNGAAATQAPVITMQPEASMAPLVTMVPLAQVLQQRAVVQPQPAYAAPVKAFVPPHLDLSKGPKPPTGFIPASEKKETA